MRTGSAVMIGGIVLGLLACGGSHVREQPADAATGPHAAADAAASSDGEAPGESDDASVGPVSSDAGASRDAASDSAAVQDAAMSGAADGSADAGGDGAQPRGNAHHFGMSFTQLAAGSSHACGLRGDGSFVCWGLDANNQVRGPDQDGGTDVAYLAAGDSHTCVVRESGSLRCWGPSLGVGLDFGQVNEPNAAGGSDYETVCGGAGHTCALRAGGSAVCWGDDRDGQVRGPNDSAATDLDQLAPMGTARPAGRTAREGVRCFGVRTRRQAFEI